MTEPKTLTLDAHQRRGKARGAQFAAPQQT
jgi:hypothetical protein